MTSSSSPATSSPARRAAAIAAALLVVIGWEVLASIALWRLGLIGWMLDYYRELLR